MTDDRVEELFLDALDLEGDARAAWLDKACAGDAALRDQVQKLIDAREKAAVLMHAAVNEAVGDWSVYSERAGPYQLIREIGRGGMGAVWLGQRDDGQFTQQVAVKLLRRGLDTDDILRRFRLERQILANLNHPNIARLFDGGMTDDGRPYLVMEFIAGVPCDVYCKSHEVTVREKVELIRKVCDAVQYAHQNLIVHRDIKANNIMVTEEGQVKLLDFGIAKLIGDESDATRTQSPLMTPQFASPEQIRGEPISTSTDIYSLGVVLYFLVTGQLPFRQRGSGSLDIVRATLELEPERHPLLTGELESIVFQAIRKDPRARYASVEHFSDDLKRYLDGRPVMARRYSSLSRAWKFAVRHKVGAGSAALLLASILTFTLITVIQSQRLARERDAVARESDRAKRTASFLQDMLKESDPLESPKQAHLKRDLLDKSAARIDQELGGQPETQAMLQVTVAKAYINLGVFDPAAALLERALSTRRKIYGATHPDVAEVLYEQARLAAARGNYPLSERLNRESLDIRRKTLPADHADISACLNNIGNALQRQGDLAGAESLYREAVAMGRRLATSPAQDSRPLAISINNLALCQYNQGDYRSAERLWRENLALNRTVFGEMHPNVGYALDNLAAVLSSLGQYTESERYFKESLALRKQVYGGEHNEVAATLNNYGALLQRRGDYSGAEAKHREALAMRLKLLGKDHIDVTVSQDNLGVALASQGRFAEGEALVREALAKRRAALPPAHSWIARSLHNLGIVLYRKGELIEAETSLRDALDRRTRALGRQNLETALTMSWLAAVLARKGSATEAAALAQEAMDIQRAKLDLEHPDIAFSLTALGAAKERLGDRAAAQAAYNEALTIRRKRLGDRSPLTLQSQSLLLTPVGRASGPRPASGPPN